MSAEVRDLWYWVTTCVDDSECWGRYGPTYAVKVKDSVWQEIKRQHNNQTVFVDKVYKYKILPGQFKRDGRSVQGNVQLYDKNNALCMNLHVPLYKQEVIIIPADDGQGDWHTIVKPKYKKK